MKDEGKSLQGVRSGQAPRKPKGRVKMGPEPVAVAGGSEKWGPWEQWGSGPGSLGVSR